MYAEQKQTSGTILELKDIIMLKNKRLTIILLMTFCSFLAKGQDREIMLGLRAGHNASFGGFTAVSIETAQTIGNSFQINGGIQYNTIGKTSIEARPSYVHEFSWGRISAEILLNYSYLSTVNHISAGAGIGLSGKWIGGKLGYYYRLFGNSGNMVNEPFNIYYEFYGNLLPETEDWDLQIGITNNEIIELERHYQPSFIAKCSYYPAQNIGVFLSAGCKPAGMFHLSADYYQSHVKIGVCYRW